MYAACVLFVLIKPRGSRIPIKVLIVDNALFSELTRFSLVSLNMLYGLRRKPRPHQSGEIITTGSLDCSNFVVQYGESLLGRYD